MPPANKYTTNKYPAAHGMALQDCNQCPVNV